MMRTMLVALLATGLLAMPGGTLGQEIRLSSGTPAERKARSEKLPRILWEKPVSYDKDLRTTPFKEVLEDLAKRYDIIFVVNKTAIGDMAATLDTAKAEKLSVTKLDGVLLTTFLDVYFRSVPVENLTY